MRAVDSSYDELTREEAQYLRENGWPLFIQCLLALPLAGPEQPRFRISSLQNALNEGLAIGAYIAIGATLSGRQYVDMAREGVPNHIWDALKFVAIDVEVQGIRVGEIHEAVEWVASLGKLPLIYTTWNAWVNYVNPPDPLSLSNDGIGLWNAYWDGNPDVDFAHLPFGGWIPEEVALEQWSGGTYVGRQFVDRNTIVHPKLIGLGGEEHMPTPEYEELKTALKETNRLLALTAAATTNQLEALRTGEVDVPIWPVGEVPLRTIRHRAYHSPNMIGQLSSTVHVVRRILANHITMHNQTGGVLDSNAPEFLRRLDTLLIELEQGVRNLEAT